MYDPRDLYQKPTMSFRSMRRRAEGWRFIAIVLLILLAMTVFIPCTQAQEDVIRCTDGTQYIYIRYPGMCPPGWWQE